MGAKEGVPAREAVPKEGFRNGCEAQLWVSGPRIVVPGKACKGGKPRGWVLWKRCERRDRLLCRETGVRDEIIRQGCQGEDAKERVASSGAVSVGKCGNIKITWNLSSQTHSFEYDQPELHSGMSNMYCRYYVKVSCIWFMLPYIEAMPLF